MPKRADVQEKASGDRERAVRVGEATTARVPLGATCAFRGAVPTTLNREDPLIPEADAARLLGMSRWSLSQLRKRRKIAYVTILRQILYYQSDLQAFVARQRVGVRG